MALIVLFALIGPLFAPFDPVKVVGPPSQPPGDAFWFGTDTAGLDVFSRLVFATRVDLFIGVTVATLSTLAGIVSGILIGMYESRRSLPGLAARGAIRLMDLAEAVPALIIVIMVVSFFGANLWSIILVIAVLFASVQTRVVRVETLRVRGDGFVDAARMAGLSQLRLTLRHVLPNAAWPALEYATVMFGGAILTTAALSYLGVGIPAPEPTWGSMIARGQSDLGLGRWWSAGFPTIALALTVVSAVLLAGLFQRRTSR
jgi:peptide/nickel transport system permease protein